MLPLSDIAEEKHLSREHLSRRLKERWEKVPEAPVINATDDVLVLDAISCGTGVAFILRALDHAQTTWDFAGQEDADGWFAAMQKINGLPRALVSDHQKGLRSAASFVFQDVLHQRCQAHIIRQALIWITKYPKTLAGRTLRVLVLRLSRVEREDESRIWVATFVAVFRTLQTISFREDRRAEWSMVVHAPVFAQSRVARARLYR